MAEPDIRDSSEYGRVTAPGETAVRGTRITVCVGNSAHLLWSARTIRAPSWEPARPRAEGGLDGADLAKVNRALTELGYVLSVGGRGRLALARFP